MPKISELTAIVGADTAAADVLPIVDVSETDAVATKKITRAELAEALGTDQTTWNTGTATARQTIAPSELQAKITDSLNASAGVAASTSGTAVDFSSIPSGVQEVKVILDLVSLSGSDNLLIQIGTGGAATTTGYISSEGSAVGSVVGSAQSSSGFILRIGSASRRITGVYTLTRLAPGSNTWIGSGAAGIEDPGGIDGSTSGGGNVTLAGELDFLRVTRTGSDTFDAGQINVRWQ